MTTGIASKPEVTESSRAASEPEGFSSTAILED
jgi:hypothetical protein